MKKINKQNAEVYNLYQKYTKEFQGNFKASGYSFSSSWKLRRTLIEHMAQLFNGPNLDILDIGCNNGLTGWELCNSLNQRDIETEIDGIDFVEEATLIAKKDFNYDSTFVADITDKQLVDSLLGTRQYQVVFCCEVFLLLHPKDYDNFFATVYSHLRSDGYFLFVFPNIKSIYHLINKVSSPEKFKYYFKYDYDLPLVNSLLQRNGFNVIATEGIDFMTNFKISLKNYSNKFKRLFSTEIAILAKKV
jgi:predicted TPR repeat methyltransferase